MTLCFTSKASLIAGLLIVLFANCSFGHTYLSSVFLNNVELNEDDCIRPHPPFEKENPIPLVTSPDMTCGWLPYANNRANRKCPISAGSKIGIQWHHNYDSDTDDILEATHKGPIQFFLANSETGAGNVWFKIYQDGYSASEGKWATDKLIANRGRIDITIPADIAPGNYLLRGEILALHNAYSVNGIQPYVGCVELAITGTGSARPSGVAFPGAYTPTGPGMLFDVYSSYSTYTIPGPAVYVPGSAPATPAPSTGSSTSAPPTSAPPTSAPTSVPPTYAPSANSLKIQVAGGSSEWWLGVIAYGGGESIVKVELKDSGVVSNWASLVDLSWAYVFDGHLQLTLPISLRVTSSTGKSITLTNVITSWSPLFTDTGKYFTPTTAPTSAPPTSAPPTSAPPTSAPPTSAPPTSVPSTPTPATPAPTNPPSGSNSNTKVTALAGVSEWWYAVSVSGNSESIRSIELKDSRSSSSFATMTSYSWGYAFITQGTPLVAPLTLRLTSQSGKSVAATIADLAPGKVVATNGNL